MSCKTLQGKYAEKLENKIKDAVECIKEMQENKLSCNLCREFGNKLLEILGGKDER